MPFEQPQFEDAKIENTQISSVEKSEISDGDKEIEQAKKNIGTFFDTHQNGRERVDAIISRVEPFLRSGLLDGEKVRRSLEQCSAITEREEFVARVFFALEPISDLKKNNPKAFIALEKTLDVIERDIFVMEIEARGFKKINEIMSYGVEKDFLHIHLAPARDLGVGQLRRLAREGFEELARTIEKDKRIKSIEAISWIVAQHPRLMEMLGFTVGDVLDEKTRQEYHIDDAREIGSATMTREEFLTRYLKRETGS